MSGEWRPWALTAGVLLCVGGLAMFVAGAGPALLIVGGVALATVLIERSYGLAAAKPSGGDWRPTDERFVDPETGKLVTVWYNPVSGLRRYVPEAEPHDR
jgi:hypothetical protein